MDARQVHTNQGVDCAGDVFFFIYTQKLCFKKCGRHWLCRFYFEKDDKICCFGFYRPCESHFYVSSELLPQTTKTLGQATSLFTAVYCELFRRLNAVKVSTAAVNFEASESNTGVVLGVDALPNDSLSVVNKLQQASCLTDDHVTPC